MRCCFLILYFYYKSENIFSKFQAQTSGFRNPGISNTLIDKYLQNHYLGTQYLHFT